MKDNIRLSFILALVCGIAAGSLRLVYSITTPVIEENARLAAIAKRREVIPAGFVFAKKEITIDGKKETIWTAKDKEGATAGFIVEVAPRGYSGKIKTTIGIGSDGLVKAVAINKLDQSETPGLGNKVTLPSFRNQFRGKNGEALKLKKDGGEIDAITSATISSRAVANGVRVGWELYDKVRHYKEITSTSYN